MSDAVHPEHYKDKCSLECKDIIQLVLGYEGFAHWCIGDAIAYLWRHKYKNGLEDVRKAAEFIRWLEKIGNSGDGERANILLDLCEEAEECYETHGDDN